MHHLHARMRRYARQHKMSVQIRKESNQPGDFQCWKLLVWTKRAAWHWVPGREQQQLGCFTAACTWRQAPKTRRCIPRTPAGPGKLLGGDKEDVPLFGPSKERPRPLSCCGAHCNVPLAPVQNGWVLPKKVAETLKAALETFSSRHI